MPPESKAAFGRRQGVSKQRIGQLVRDGKIDGAALVLVDGKTLIDSDIAAAQLRSRLDPGQRLGQRHSIGRQPRRPSTPIEVQPGWLDTAVAMLLEIPADTAWEAVSLGVEPWRAWALSEAARKNLLFELRDRLGVDVDSVTFDAIPWPAIFAEYGVNAPVSVKAWHASKARHDAAWQAAEAAEREVG